MSTQTMIAQGANVLGTSFTSNLSSTKNLSNDGNFKEFLSSNLKSNTSDNISIVEKKMKSTDILAESKASSPPEKKQNVKISKETEDIHKMDDNYNLDKIKDKVSKLSEKIKSVVKESLDIDEEELNQLMNNLGYVMTDLLNPDKLKNLCMAASGETDISSLLTNEGLSTQLTNLLKDISELNMDDFGITDEELKYLLNSSQKESKLTQFEMNPNGLSENVGDMNTNAKKAVEDGTDQTLITKNSDGQLNQDLKVIVEKDGGMNQQLSVNSEQSTNSQSGSSLGQGMSDQANNENNQQKNVDTTMDSNAEQIINNLSFTSIRNVDGLNQQIVEVTQMRDIVNQIVKEIRINIKPDTTSMDLQLNPDNLGKVNLSIVAKDGIITAQFAVQSSAAKEAIESQLQLLKDNLNNQGVKVESIEVTVSNFSFSESNQMYQEGKEQKQNSKKFILDSMEETNDISNDSSMNDDIMLKNGNTVDYTA